MAPDYIKIFITIILAVLGWIIGHYFNSKRTRDQKRRDISVEHLINAYRILTNDISHRIETPERSEKLENILSDIQLFGSSYQVMLARNLAKEIASGGEFQLDQLINSLRDDLRKELHLSKIEGNVEWLRFNNKNKVC